MRDCNYVIAWFFLLRTCWLSLVVLGHSIILSSSFLRASFFPGHGPSNFDVISISYRELKEPLEPLVSLGVSHIYLSTNRISVKCWAVNSLTTSSVLSHISQMYLFFLKYSLRILKLKALTFRETIIKAKSKKMISYEIVLLFKLLHNLHIWK